MAAKKTKKTIARKTATNGGGLPSHLQKRMQEDAGKGVSTAQEDNLVPLIYVLQANSPQAVKRSPDYIKGAEAGGIWLRGSEPPVIDGEEGILFQPCHFSKDWVEWVPRDSGGGFVGRHESCPEEAERTTDPQNPNRVRFILPNGNEVIETRYHIGYVLLPDGRALPYVIPLSATGHTVSRHWMFLMNAKQIPGAGTAASYACLYRLRTKFRTNNWGDWYMFDVTDEGWVQDEAAYERGAKLHAAFAQGAKVAEAPEATETDDAAM